MFCCQNKKPSCKGTVVTITVTTLLTLLSLSVIHAPCLPSFCGKIKQCFCKCKQECSSSSCTCGEDAE